VALSAARTFKDVIVVAAAVFFVVVKPLNALMASQTKDTPATTCKCPYCMHSVPLQATRCPSCTCDLEPALVCVEQACAEARALERERARRVFFQEPVYTGAMRSSV
jgi:hypothetical protein